MPRKVTQKSKLKIQNYISKIKIKTSKIPKKFLVLSFGFVLCALSFYFFWDLPNPKNLTSHPAPASTKLLDRQGRLIYEIFADERRTPITLSSLPKYVWQATLAAEDKDFYTHGGFSFRGIFRAFFNTFFRGHLQGGSTITQQLVKKALLSDDRTIRRKVREFILSVAVEALYGKDQILEMYLNQVPYGGTAYGLESAAYTYFNKASKDLTLAEAALLAGLPAAPSYYTPFGAHPELAKERQKYVLDQMLEDKFITREEYASASAQALGYSLPPSIQAPHFSLWVKDFLINKYGLETVEQGGLTVTTTLDLDLQNFAQDTVASETAKLTRENVGNGATLVTNPQTGAILAMVGSRDYFDIEHDGNVNVVLRPRQPGSAIKPVNYAIAIEHRLITPSTVLADKPTCFVQPNQKDYCPDNYDNQFHGPVQARFALGNSFNIPAVKVLVLNGLRDFIATSSAFGITTWQDPTHYGPSLTLGGGEVKMLDLATAYGVLADAGQRVDLNPILEVRNRSGQVLESVKSREISADQAQKADLYSYYTVNSKFYIPLAPPNVRVISAETAFLISHILYDNGARSATFGVSSYLNISGHPEVSVKTGTTNDKRDNWTIGYNPDILVAVWVGNNDNSPMSRVASGVTGASPIWNKITTYALKHLPQHWPVQPPGIQGALVCDISGLKVPDSPSGECQPRYEYFLRGTVPPPDIGLRRDIPIFRPTQAPATAAQIAQNPDQIEIQNHSAVIDPLGTILCLDCQGGYGEPDFIRLDASGKAIR
jgi:penicillin-binding protein 1C